MSTAALLLRDRDLKGLLVQFGEKLSFADTVIVIHQNPGNLAADAGSNERHMAVHVCVIRRNGVESQAVSKECRIRQAAARTRAPSTPISSLRFRVD